MRRPAEMPDDYDDYGYDEDADLEDGAVYLADEPGMARKGGAVVAFLLLFVFVVLGLGGFWLYSQINPTPSGAEVTVVIPNDTGIATISRILEEQGVIASGTIFRYYARIKGIGPVRPGEYDRLRRGLPMDDVIARLEAGPVPIRTTDLPLPEGLTLADTTTRIKQKFPQMDDAELATALATVRSRHQPPDKPVDGFLFPATYRVTEAQYADEPALVGQMVAKFDEVADEVDLDAGAAKLSAAAGRPITAYDVLKVASYVEAEAKVPEDRPRIARVIYNRLKKNMTLDIDASLFAALGQHKERLTESDKNVDSPYNLYRNRGLTPTPIDSPGADSLRAALNPSTEPDADAWLYYVLSDKEGHHSFSKTREEHDRKVQEARRAGLL